MYSTSYGNFVGTREQLLALEYDTGAVLRRITVSLAGARRALSLPSGATDAPSGSSRDVLVTDRIDCFCFSPPQPPNMVHIFE